MWSRFIVVPYSYNLLDDYRLRNHLGPKQEQYEAVLKMDKLDKTIAREQENEHRRFKSYTSFQKCISRLSLHSASPQFGLDHRSET